MSRANTTSHSASSLRLAIVTPTYNEVRNVAILLEAIATTSQVHPNVYFTVFVIDDSSPDGTADEAKRLAKVLKTNNFSIEVIVRQVKDGLGRAYIFGFKEVLKVKPAFDYILQMDADLSHDPTYISGFIHQAEAGTDFVVASRYLPGGGTPDWAFSRKLLSRGGNIYTRSILGNRISDYTGGYNLYAADLLRKIDIDTVQAGGYGFLIELKYRALRAANTVSEIPIVFLDRKHGSSKIPKSTLFKNFILVPKIRFQKDQ